MTQSESYLRACKTEDKGEYAISGIKTRLQIAPIWTDSGLSRDFFHASLSLGRGNESPGCSNSSRQIMRFLEPFFSRSLWRPSQRETVRIYLGTTLCPHEWPTARSYELFAYWIFTLFGPFTDWMFTEGFFLSVPMGKRSNISLCLDLSTIRKSLGVCDCCFTGPFCSCLLSSRS